MLLGNLFQKMKARIDSYSFRLNFRVRPQDFSRKRKLSFSEMILLILTAVGKSIQVGIDEFLLDLDLGYSTYSKQAFSKGRQRIDPEAFHDLHQLSTDFFYANIPFKTFSGYRVSAVDGSKIDLPFNKELLSIYGCQPGTNNAIQSLISCLVDVLNHVVLDGIMAPCNASEKELAKQHANYLLKNALHDVKELILFDRGYPSATLMKYLNDAGLYYVMRCSQSFCKYFLHKVKGDDCTITHTFSKTGIKLTFRVIRIQLSPSETEVLITNVKDKSITVEQFKELYHLRWGIETTYNYFKNVFALENFTGTTPCAVLQDFYAVLFLYNVSAVLLYENDTRLEELYKNSTNKYRYKTNMKMLISKVRENLIRIVCFCDSEDKLSRCLNRLLKQLETELVPIRKDRHYQRERVHPTVKYPQNQKR